jgi:hypothetical protein
MTASELLQALQTNIRPRQLAAGGPDVTPVTFFPMRGRIDWNNAGSWTLPARSHGRDRTMQLH